MICFPKEKMGNTLEQHRAAIGGNAARQLSRGWAHSTGIFKPFTTTDQNRKKTQGRAKATKIHATEVILLGFMFTLLSMACPLAQTLFGYVLCDHGSLQMAGSLDSRVIVLGPCSDTGMQEPLHQGCWGQKRMTKRSTSPYFSANFKPSTAGKKMAQIHLEDQNPDQDSDPGLQVSSYIQALISECSHVHRSCMILTTTK